MYFITDKFGFISGFYPDTSIEGEPIIRAKHCTDVREAYPFTNRGEAEKAYRKTYLAKWWHCVMCSTDLPVRSESDQQAMSC